MSFVFISCASLDLLFFLSVYKLLLSIVYMDMPNQELLVSISDALVLAGSDLSEATD